MGGVFATGCQTAWQVTPEAVPLRTNGVPQPSPYTEATVVGVALDDQHMSTGPRATATSTARTTVTRLPAPHGAHREPRA